MFEVQDEHDGRAGGRDVLSSPILLLNRYFAPISVTTARRGMVLLFCGAALALDEAGDTHDFRTWSRLPVRDDDDRLPIVDGELRLPRVMHLLRYDRTPRVGVRLTRRNLLLRDAYQCQYCGRRPGTRELNVDHVLPRARGGGDTWENLVISCRSCNLLKGKRTPPEADMVLLKRPERPRWTLSARIAMTVKSPFSEWRPFLG